MKNTLFIAITFFTIWAQYIAMAASNSSQRIISLSPGTTEILFALGLDQEIVGVTDFCNYPQEAKLKEKVGGYDNQNFEKIISLRPSIVVMLPYHRKMILNLKSFGIHALEVKNETLDEIIQSIDSIGKQVGRSENAQRLVLDIESQLRQCKLLTQPLKKKRALFIVGRNLGTLEQIYAVGSGAFINELIHIAGGINILSDVPIKYPKISQEEILSRDPEMIIETYQTTLLNQDQILFHQKAWLQYSLLSAVQTDNLHYIAENFMLIPGPRIVTILNELVKVLHPQIAHKLKAH